MMSDLNKMRNNSALYEKQLLPILKTELEVLYYAFQLCVIRFRSVCAVTIFPMGVEDRFLQR